MMIQSDLSSLSGTFQNQHQRKDEAVQTQQQTHDPLVLWVWNEWEREQKNAPKIQDKGAENAHSQLNWTYHDCCD